MALTMKKISIAAALLLAIILLPLDNAVAQDGVKFPANQFGTANLAVPQSGQSADLETLFNAHADNFELVKHFTERHYVKRLSKSVGRLDLLVNGREGGQWVEVCTGTVISKDLVITAAHCFRSRDGRPLNISQVRFRIGFYGGPAGDGRDFQAEFPPREEDVQADYAILRVSGLEAANIKSIPLGFESPDASQELFVIHHPLGKPMRVTRRFCRAATAAPVTLTDLRHLCDTLPGSSGAPVFTDEGRRLIAIHYKGGLDNTSSDSFNSARLLASLRTFSATLARTASSEAGQLPQDTPTSKEPPPYGVQQPEQSHEQASRVVPYQNPTSNRVGSLLGRAVSEAPPVRNITQGEADFDRDNAGRPVCREYVQTVNVGGRTEQAMGTACRKTDGTWVIVQ
ncbi:trypsin-like peptidase domain-containing protein [Azospirillum brasilense]